MVPKRLCVAFASCKLSESAHQVIHKSSKFRLFFIIHRWHRFSQIFAITISEPLRQNQRSTRPGEIIGHAKNLIRKILFIFFLIMQRFPKNIDFTFYANLFHCSFLMGKFFPDFLCNGLFLFVSVIILQVPHNAESNNQGEIP